MSIISSIKRTFYLIYMTQLFNPHCERSSLLQISFFMSSSSLLYSITLDTVCLSTLLFIFLWVSKLSFYSLFLTRLYSNIFSLIKEANTYLLSFKLFSIYIHSIFLFNSNYSFRVSTFFCHTFLGFSGILI